MLKEFPKRGSYQAIPSFLPLTLEALENWMKMEALEKEANIMAAKKGLALKDYLVKLQEAADEVANERNLGKITVSHHHGGEFLCVGTGDKICLSILEEAQSRVNKKYKFEE